MSRRPALPEALTPITAEASVLGGVLVRPDVLRELAELQVDHFYDLRHRVVFTAMRALAAAGTPIDTTTLEQEIARDGKIEAVGGITFLGELALIVPTPDNVLAYARDVRLAARNRVALVALDKARESVVSGFYPAAEVLEETVAELARFGERVPAPDAARPNKWCRGLGALLGDGEPDDDDREDWVIRDLVPRAAPTLFAGPAKAGKTTCSLDLAISIALGVDWLGFEYCGPAGGERVIVVCTEDGERRLRKRIWELCRRRNVVPFNERLMANLDVCTTKLHLPNAEDEARLGGELREWGASVCIIDNLTRIMIGDPNKTRDAAELARGWYRLGDLSGSTIMLLHHTKKDDGEKRSDKDPFDQIKGNGDFVAAARNAILALPIRSEEGNDPIRTTEVRMRGNFDLRTDGFALGYERYQDVQGRWVSSISNRGDMNDVRAEITRVQKEARQAARAREAQAEDARRADLAVAMATRNGTVSCVQLATALGMKSDRSVAPILNDLVTSGRLVKAGKAGYGLPARQGDLSQLGAHP